MLFEYIRSIGAKSSTMSYITGDRPVMRTYVLYLCTGGRMQVCLRYVLYSVYGDTPQTRDLDRVLRVRVRPTISCALPVIYEGISYKHTYLPASEAAKYLPLPHKNAIKIISENNKNNPPLSNKADKQPVISQLWLYTQYIRVPNLVSTRYSRYGI